MKKYLLTITLLLGNASYGMMSTANTEINEGLTYAQLNKVTSTFIDLATKFKNAQSEFFKANNGQDGDISVTLTTPMTTPTPSTYSLTFKGVDFTTLDKNLQTLQSLQNYLPNSVSYSLKFLDALKNESTNLENIQYAFEAEETLKSTIGILQPRTEASFTEIVKALQTQEDALEVFTSAYSNGFVDKTKKILLSLTKEYENLKIGKALAAKIKALLLPLKDESQYGKAEAPLAQWKPAINTTNGISFPLIPDTDSFQWQLMKVTVKLTSYTPKGGEIYYYYQPSGETNGEGTMKYSGNIRSVNTARTALLSFVNSIKFA